MMISTRSSVRDVQHAGDCNIPHNESTVDRHVAHKGTLDSHEFTLLNWNVYKGFKEGWKEDFKKLATVNDILTVQEARLSDDLPYILSESHENWDISIAFRYNGKETGVLTASRIAPEFTCSFRINEPLFALPKTAIVTVYPFSDTEQSLMIVNIHAVNLTFGTGNFKKQLHMAEDVISDHPGPLILSGDFNTWNSKRTEILMEFAKRLGLIPVQFPGQNKTRIFGKSVDHVYYRELMVMKSEAIKVTSSDHNPLMVTFRLKN